MSNDFKIDWGTAEPWTFAAFGGTVIALGPDGFWQFNTPDPRSEGIARAVQRLSEGQEYRAGAASYMAGEGD